MERQRTWILRLAVGLLGAALLVDQLLVFRLCAAGVGQRLAYVLGVAAPAAAALGASRTWMRACPSQATALARRAAYLGLAAAGAWLLGLLMLAWLAQKLLGKDQPPWFIAAAIGLAWLLAFPLLGGALGLALRAGAAAIGRLGFAEALGGVLACLGLPLALWMGLPVASLLATLLPVGAAYALAALAGPLPADDAGPPRRRPSAAVMVTFPLVVAALVAGEIGEPWLQIPGGGKKSQVAQRAWTTEGLVAVTKPTSKHFGYTVDGSPLVPLASLKPDSLKFQAGPAELAYAMDDDSTGETLVIGSGGGREVQLALSRGRGLVTAVERQPAVVKGVVLDRFATETARLLAPSSRLRVSIGDGRSNAPRPGRDLRRIIVVASELYVPVPPRLLAWSRRELTREAIGAYLEGLSPKGTLVLVTRSSDLPSLVATAGAALGLGPDDAAGHMLACGTKDEVGLLVRREALGSAERQRLGKFCRRRRMSIHDFVDPSAAGRPGEAGEEPTPIAPDSVLPGPDWSAGVASDDRPFLEGRPPVGGLAGLVLAELRSAVGAPHPAESEPGDGPATGDAAEPAPSALATPGAASSAPLDRAGKERKAGPVPKPATTTVAPNDLPLTTAPLAWAGALMAALLVLVTWLLPRRGRALPRAPLTLRAAVIPLGIGLALGELGTLHYLVGALGHPIYAWPLLVPLGLVGVGAGRLLVDVVPPRKLRRSLELLTGAGVVLLVLLLALGPRLSLLWGAAFGWRALVGALLATVLGLVLGAPLAIVLRLVAAEEGKSCVGDAPGVARCWGWHMGGWALGGSVGAVLARHVGVSSLLLLAALSAIVTAVLAMYDRQGSGGAEPSSAAATQQ